MKTDNNPIKSSFNNSKIISCIINPAARDGQSIKIWEIVKNKLEKEGLSTELYITEKVGHASEIAYSLRERTDIQVIVACGGDGTVHEVSSGLRGSNIPLAVIPAGTGNDVARVHGYLLDDLDDTINIIINGVDRNIGALRIEAEPMPKEDSYPSPSADSKWNGTAKVKNRIVRWIFHEADSGITSLVSRAKLKRGKWIKGNLKYTYLGITEILKWKKRNAWVKIDNESPVIINFSLFVFTLSEFFGGGYWVAPGASPIKDHAYLCKAWNLTRLQMLLLMGPLRKGKHVGKWGITLDACKTLEIKSVNQNNEPVDIAHSPPLPINVDGEPCLQTPAIIEFHPKQLWLRGSKDVSWDAS
ncbi:MAG: diacylglycerol kinase family protein [Candidatus Marinimicrobia bacterium]|nr:diacylglycerol kinase family protein [Candidatus Neomarinimicrobiota bacterium]